ncbi:hypothetical protein ACI7BZ_17705 [Xanthobacter sp. AM11]|uniref:hypothetical protein n=1 Tax=Xanthobacter sp. AM11 TaxID=3380643 RepID=UPI0039BF58CB
MTRLVRVGVLLSFLALAAGRSPAAAQTPEGVLDYYTQLQIAQGAGFPAYRIEPGAAGPVASGGLHGEQARLALVLDEAHLYLRIDAAGDDAAAAFVTELAVWFDAEGFPLVGLSERGLTAGVPFGGRVRFYSRASGRWNLVTDRVWPALDEALCRTPAQAVDEATAAGEGLGRAITLLPRTGIDPQVWCVAPSPMAGQGVAVSWDRAAAGFGQQTPLPGPPPWPDAPSP